MTVAATMPTRWHRHAIPPAPISVLFVHGTKDPLVRIEGGPMLRNRGVAISAGPERRHSGATGTARHCNRWTLRTCPNRTDDGTSVRRELYTGGKQGTGSGGLHVIEGGEPRTGPTGPQYLPAFLVGKAAAAITDGTEAIRGSFSNATLAGRGTGVAGKGWVGHSCPAHTFCQSKLSRYALSIGAVCSPSSRPSARPLPTMRAHGDGGAPRRPGPAGYVGCDSG